MFDKMLDFMLAQLAGTAVWKGVCALAALPLHHLFILGGVVWLCIRLIKVAIPLLKLLRD